MFNLNISTYSPAQRMQYLFIGIFLVLNFAISYLGSHLLRHRVQHHLTIQRDDPKDKAPSVPINHLVPWLSIGDFATYIWYIRKIPGGRWGILMLGTAVFSLAQQYFVIAFITPLPQITTCDFTIGINSVALSEPVLQAAPLWYGVTIVNTAFSWAEANNSTIGIYEKVPSNLDALRNFSPEPSDIIGKWTCTEQPGIAIPTSKTKTKKEVIDYVDKQNFMYSSYNTGNWSSAWGERDDLYSSPTACVIWSPDQPSKARKQWSVRVIMVDSLDYRTSQSVVNTTNFQCSVVRNSSIWPLPLVPSHESLDSWSDYLFGAIHHFNTSTYRPKLEKVLNTMFILSGSGNQWTQSLRADQDKKYGCLADGLAIGIGIYIMLFFLIFMLLLVIAANIYAFRYYKLGHDGKMEDELSSVPIDLLSWQLAMIKVSTGNEHMTMKDMRTVSYAYVRKSRDPILELRFVENKHSKSQSVPLLPISEGQDELESSHRTTAIGRSSSISLDNHRAMEQSRHSATI